MNTELIKLAYQLGYKAGMEKTAKPISREDFGKARRILGLPEYDDDADYERHLKDRKRQMILTPAILGLVGGLAGAGMGYDAGSYYHGEPGKGALIGALAGVGIGGLEGLGLGALGNLLAKKRLERFAKDQKKHELKQTEEMAPAINPFVIPELRSGSGALR